MAFWQGKSVFLTGHTGFKGSWLSLWLHQLGARVTGYSLPAEDLSLFKLAEVAALLERSLEGDVRDAATLQKSLKLSAPEIVIHFAAQPLVRESYRTPVDTFSTNVMGTTHLLEAARGCPSVRAILVITTDKCYENKEWLWPYRENEALGGYDPYSASKAAAELVCASYRNSFFNPAEYAKHRVALASARAGNVIGGGDFAKDRLIPDCIASMIKNETIRIRNPHAVRPWQHVLESLSGYLRLAEKLYTSGPTYGEAWNFGPDQSDARPVEWIVKRLCEKWGKGLKYSVDSGPHPHEASTLMLDTSKARKKLDWQPRWNLDVALDKIVDWVSGTHNSREVRNVSLRQISEFETAGAKSQGVLL